MKKKVLFALIALFSFVSAWAADDVTVGDYTVTLSSAKLVIPAGANSSVDIPTVTTVKKGGSSIAYQSGAVFNSAGEVVNTITELGDYFVQVSADNKTFYVPFQVAKVATEGIEYDFVWNEATYNASQQNRGIKAYQDGYPSVDWYDFSTSKRLQDVLGGPKEVPTEEQLVGYTRTWESAVNCVTDAGWIEEGYPRLIPFNENNTRYKWLVQYDLGETTITSDYTAYGALGNGTTISQLFDDQFGAGCGTRIETKTEALKTTPEILLGGGTSSEAITFDFNNFQAIIFTGVVSAYPNVATIEYAGTTTEGPGFTLVGAPANATYDADIVKEKTEAATAVDPINSVGTYYYRIKFYKMVENEKTYTSTIYSLPFKVVGKQVTINPSRATKVYGQPDPDPEFAFDATSLASGDAVETAIKPFLVFKRATVNGAGENVREYNYYIGFTQDYLDGKCNYDIKILQNNALLEITPAPLTVTVTNDNKMWAQNDPSFADYTIVSGLVQNADLGINDTKDNVSITITRPSAGTADGEKINADLDQDGKPVFRVEGDKGYPFAGEAANYTVIFTNGFAITPSTNTSGITVTFDPASYKYTGAEQKPDPIVMDGTKELELGTDYDLDTTYDTDGYKDNKNAGTATCQITLKGNYIATGDASKKQGTFTITKLPLTVYATSYDAEPANGYGVEYDGFVSGEDATNAAGFTTPDAPIVSKGVSIEQDVYALVIKKEGWSATNYEITAKDGILALNGKPTIYARPDAKTQEYTGTVDKALTFATYTSRQYTADSKMESNPVIAVVGQPVYVIAKEDPTNANVGEYDITLRGATVLKDYNVVYDDLADGYTITYKNLILKGINTSKIYGDADPTFDALVYDGETPWTREQMNAAGIINNGPNNTGYYVGCGTWQNNRWNHGENVKGGSNEDGTYPITVGLRSRVYGNYYINGTENGKFDILPFAAKVTADDKTKQFGQADPEFTVTITDNNNAQGHIIGTAVSNAFVSELAEYWVATRPDAGTEAGEAKGEHDIVVAAPKVGEQDVKPNNFTLTFVDGTLTITPAQIAVLAKDQYVDYALDYDKKINPYDVIVVTPTETLVWQKSSQEGLSDDQVTINNKIKALVKLTVAKGKNKLGGNEDAFVLNLQSDDYVLATEDVVLSDDYVYGGATIKNGFKNGWLTIYALETIPLENAELAALVGVDADEANTNPSILQKVLNDHKADGVTVKVKLPARKMDKDEWYAWVLPFAVKPSALFKDGVFGYGAAEILDASKSKGENVVFSLQIAKDIPANTPFIVKVEKDMTAAQVNALVFNDVEIAKMDYLTDDPSTDADGVSFVGLYWDYKGPKANERYLAKVTPTDAPADYVAHRDFWPGGEKSKGVTLVRTNAFLQFASAELSAKARIYIENEDGTLTAINGVDADAEVAYGEGWYTINGVKLEGEPVTSGTYIFNGKKVFIQK